MIKTKTNEDVLKEAKQVMNEKCLENINNPQAIAAWYSEIDDARDRGSHYEIAARDTFDGNPRLIRL